LAGFQGVDFSNTTLFQYSYRHGKFFLHEQLILIQPCFFTDEKREQLGFFHRQDAKVAKMDWISGSLHFLGALGVLALNF